MASGHYLKIDMDPANTSTTRYASNVTGATWTLTNTTPGDELARVVTIVNDAVTDHSAKTAILTGTDADGKAQTETVNLPGASATITSTKHFLTLTSVVPSATIGGDTMDIGIGDDIVSKTIPVNRWSSSPAQARIDTTGTIDLDIETTYDPPNRPDLFTWTNQDSAVWMSAGNVADSDDSNLPLEVAVEAVRVQINSYTDTAEAQIWITQSDDK
jgi:hypothetical protein